VPFTLTRSILVILLPGAITLSPYLFNLLYTLPQFMAWYEGHKMESYFFVFSAAVVIGSVYEGISSIVEVQLDKIVKKRHPDLDKEWYSYLCKSYSAEPVAYRYISRRATTMYFEFSMAYSMIFVGYGFSLNLDRIDFFHDCFQKPAFVLIFWVLAYYFFRQAMGTHNVLSKIRSELYKAER
jgi:hypothetical protein